MKPQALLPLAATALSLLPAASAWTFTWRDENGSASVQNGNQPQPCTEINQAKDAQFDFHPESDSYNFYIWSNNNCSGAPQGYSPILWRHNASRDLHSYMIDYGDKSGPVSTATASTTTTSATGAGSAGTSAASSAATATPTDGEGGGGGGGLGGGAIAGIVIGVVAAIAILGALFFFLGRRKRQNAAAAEAATAPAPPAPVDQQQGGPGGGAAGTGYPQEFFAEKKDAFVEKGPVELPDGNQVSEMSTSHAVVEMSNSHSVVEMSDSQRVNELEAPYRGTHH